MPLLGRLEAWLVPDSLRSDWRTPFLLRVWAYGMSFGLVFGALAVTQGLWWLALAQSYLFTSGVLCLLLLRTTARLELVTHVSLAAASPFLAFAGVLQNPPNPITPVFLLLVPLLAGFLLSRRVTWFWLGVSMVLGGVAEWLMANGFHAQGRCGRIRAWWWGSISRR